MAIDFYKYYALGNDYIVIDRVFMTGSVSAVAKGEFAEAFLRYF